MTQRDPNDANHDHSVDPREAPPRGDATDDASLTPQQRMLELAHLPPSHVERQAFVATLNELGAADQLLWQALNAETDELRLALAEANREGPEMSPDFMRRLGLIPEGKPGLSSEIAENAAPLPRLAGEAGKAGMRARLQQPVGWRSVAAVLLVSLLGVAAYYYATLEPPPPGPLPAGVSTALAKAALDAHQAGVPLDLQTDSLESATEALAGRKLPFAAALLTPAGNWRLKGEAVVSLAGTPAVLTRWQNGDAESSLYQLPSGAFDTPKRFTETTALLGTGAKARSIKMWPGLDGSCLWALVEEGDGSNANPFLYGAYGR